jgi:beta-N-acetylhexosaminidase
MNAHLHLQQALLMQRLLQEKHPVIGIATYNPYDLQAFPELSTYLATYECTPPALAAAVRVLFGEVHPQGRLPVSLPGL